MRRGSPVVSMQRSLHASRDKAGALGLLNEMTVFKVLDLGASSTVFPKTGLEMAGAWEY